MTKQSSDRDIDEVRAMIMADPTLAARYRFRQRLAGLGDAFRRVREQRGLTQMKLAKIIGIDQADVSRFENGEGERGPTIETLAKYAHALNLDLSVGLVQAGEGRSDQAASPEAWATL